MTVSQTTLRHHLGTHAFTTNMERRRRMAGWDTSMLAEKVKAAVAAAHTLEEWRKARETVYNRYSASMLRFAMDRARAKTVFKHKTRRDRAFAVCMRTLCAGSLPKNTLFLIGDGNCNGGGRRKVPTMEFYRYVARYAVVVLIDEAYTSARSMCCSAPVQRSRGSQCRDNRCTRNAGEELTFSAWAAVRRAVGLPVADVDHTEACHLTVNRDLSAAIMMCGIALCIGDAIADSDRQVIHALSIGADAVRRFDASRM